jgi:citronellol/citronellal dehydrogenase
MKRLELLAGQIVANTGKLKGKTVVVTGGSRGIGLAIVRKCAKDGANVAILAKTTEENPKLPGTIYSAAKEIEQAGGKALPLACDIRNDKAVEDCIKKIVDTFGGIDILINNASAISLTPTEETSLKKYDLMHQINIRGTFLLSKLCIPYLKKSSNPHIINLSPPLDMDPKWFAPHVAYTMAKYGMSMCVLGMAEELKPFGIGVNALWPRTGIATAAVKNLLGGDTAMRISRTDEILADAAYVILTSDSKKTTGNFFIVSSIS